MGTHIYSLLPSRGLLVEPTAELQGDQDQFGRATLTNLHDRTTNITTAVPGPQESSPQGVNFGNDWMRQSFKPETLKGADTTRKDVSESLSYAAHKEHGKLTSPTRYVGDDVMTVLTTSPATSSKAGTAVGDRGKRVLIYSRGRSGSSFVAQIIARDPTFYYVFEPFLFYPMGVAKVIEPGNSRYHTCSPICRIETTAERYLRDVFQCSFIDLYHDWSATSLQLNIESKPRSVWQIIFCRTNEMLCKLGITKTLSGDNCNEFPHRIVKTIRVQNVTAIRQLMLDGVNVVHLVRDPRGKVNSELQYNLALHNKNGLLSSFASQLRFVRLSATALCADLAVTLTGFADILNAYPHLMMFYKRVHYETVGISPMNFAEELYDFIGLEMQSSVRDWIQQATQNEKPGLFSTYRISNETVHRWRDQLHPRFIEAVETIPACQAVLTYLNYTFPYAP